MPHFQFQYSFFLFGLALLPILLLLFLFAKNRKKKAFNKIGDPILVKQLLANYNTSSYIKKFFLFTGAMGLLIIALANLRTPSGSDKLSSNGIDVMIAIDVSKSMLAEDIKPSRLERAKQLMNKLVDKLDNDRIGIVVFAGKAYMQMPLSTDHAAAKMFIESSSTESIPTQGTVIGDALKMCYASFNKNEKKYKAIVLISDGEDHDENAIKIADQLGQEGVMINTIGIGSPQGSTIIDETTGELKKDKDGNTVITKLNQDELKSIAEKGNGVYQLFSNSDAVVAGVAAQLNSMDKRSVTDDSLLRYKTYFQYLAGLALIFLLIEFFIAEIKKTKTSRLKPLMTLAFLFTSLLASAQNEKENIKKGNDAYKKNDFTAAVNDYNTALKKEPANATAQFNIGNALYRSKKTDESISAYDNAIKYLNKPVEKANAYYNKGVVLQNNNKIPECIEAYKNALILSPNDDDARQNLQKALKKQQQQQQQQKQNKDQNKDQQKKQDQQPKPKPSKISQKDAEQKLQALQQQEANLQNKLHKVNAASVDKPEKDW